jgi:hypothetical protein
MPRSRSPNGGFGVSLTRRDKGTKIVAQGDFECNRDVTTTIGSINQLTASAAATYSLRRQIESPDDPVDSKPSVAGLGSRIDAELGL